MSLLHVFSVYRTNFDEEITEIKKDIFVSFSCIGRNLMKKLPKLRKNFVSFSFIRTNFDE